MHVFFLEIAPLKCKKTKNKTKQTKKQTNKQNPRARGRVLKSVVSALIDNGKLACQIMSLKALMRT